MSHFAVLVLGENPEQQLAPFNEQLETPRYMKYTKGQLIEEGRKWIEEYKNGTYAEYLSDKEKYKANCKNESHINYLENEFSKRLSWTDEEVYQNEVSDYEEENIGKDGEVYSTYNPKSKWDWYVLGGRYLGRLLLKNKAAYSESGRSGTGGNHPTHKGGVDSAYKRDIDFCKMKEEKIKLAEMWWEEAQKLDDTMKYLQYSIEKGETREQYIESHSKFTAFAVLKDGCWYERGEMGWWGVVHDEKDENEWATKFEELLNEVSDDTLISIYDCHI